MVTIAVTQGDRADAMYLVQDGRLGVWIKPHDEGAVTPQRVRTLHSGEFFGEIGACCAA